VSGDGAPDDVGRLLLERFPLVDDHPDVAGLLRDAEALAALGPALVASYRDAGVTAVVAPEARGPVLGALAAVSLGVGLVLVRKDPANHPGADLKVRSEPTWRGAPIDFQGRSFDLDPSDRVLIVDDWITTGSSIRAVAAVVGRIGATVVGVSVLVDKADPATLVELNVRALVRFADIGRGATATPSTVRPPTGTRGEEDHRE
jgi:adenine phosphoribosyltransferase